jgi:AraC-like DNA-binding protein
MISLKKLDGGGDTDVQKMMENASMLGIELIELLWIPRNKLPHYSVIDLIGYFIPLIDKNTNIFDEDKINREWIDGTVKFYPDKNGRCWGYVYDVPENRNLLASSLVNGWFKIVDQKIREQIIELAKNNNLKTEPVPTAPILTKKSISEKNNEETIIKLLKAEEELKMKLKYLEEELERAKGDKASQVNKRLRGVHVKRELLETQNEEINVN